MATSDRIILKRTLGGGQINAGKFSNRLILKGGRQMLWYLYVI